MLAINEKVPSQYNVFSVLDDFKIHLIDRITKIKLRVKPIKAKQPST